MKIHTSRRNSWIQAVSKSASGALAMLLVCTAATNSVHAQTSIWTGSAGADWRTNGSGSANWQVTPGTPTSWTNGNKALFGDSYSTGTSTLQITNRDINVQATPTIRASSIEFNNTQGAYNFSGSVVQVGPAGTASGANTGFLVNGDGTIGTNSGSILLSGTGTDRISSSTPIYLNGGGISLNSGTTAATSEQLGTLTLTANSYLDFSGGGGTLLFSSLSAVPATSSLVLNVFNFDTSTDHLQLLQAPTSNVTINFYSGSTANSSQQVTYTAEVVPEPSTILAGLGLVGFLGWRERRRISSLFKRGQGEEALATA